MKKLISKVLLALITLSVATPVCTGVPSIALQGIKACKKGVFVYLPGLHGAALGAALVKMLQEFDVLRFEDYSPETITRQLGSTIAENNERHLACKRLRRIAVLSGALLGAFAGKFFLRGLYN